MRLLLLIFFSYFLCPGCGVSERTVAGRYTLQGEEKTKLILNKDRSFELVKNTSSPSAMLFGNDEGLHFRTAGTWTLDKGGLLMLNSFSDMKEAPLYNDVVIGQADITTFTFYDAYGDYVPIRMVKFPGNRTRLHSNQHFSFFAGDFQPNDTLEFYFQGYRPFRYINSGPTNHRHRVVLFEETRWGFFTNYTCEIKNAKIIDARNKLVFSK